MTSSGQNRAPRRIAVMLPRFSRYGGAEQFGYNLAAELGKRGHLVDFICAKQDAAPPPGVTIRKVGRIGLFRVCKAVSFALRAEKLRQQQQYDCVIGLGKTFKQDIMRVGGGPAPKYRACMEMARQGWQRLRLKIRHKLCPHHIFDYWLERKRYNPQTRVVAVSHMMRDYVAECFGLSRIDIIYNQPDLTRFTPPTETEKSAARLKLDIAAATLAIGHAGTNYTIKGTDYLIRALQSLPDTYHLYVAGGRKHGKQDRLAASLGVANRVHFLGRVDDMPGYLKAMDIFALPTYFDPCSNAVLEALAVGLPTMSSKFNGSSYFLPTRQVIDDPADVPKLASILKELGAQAEKNRTQLPASGFAWPEDLPAGVGAFADYVEAFIREKDDCRG